MTKVSKAIRAKLRAKAESLGCRYRIRASGTVEFHGPMPNASHQTGWWHFAWDTHEAIAQINSED